MGIYVYFTIAILVLVGMSIVYGFLKELDEQENTHNFRNDEDELFFWICAVMCSAVWPVAIPILVLIGVSFLAVNLGKTIASRKSKKS